MNQVLELQNITFTDKGIERIRNISLSIYAGEQIALLGASGAGKSTLISIANGTITPTKGDVRWNGILVNDLTNYQRNEIGTIWQDLRLIEELNVGQNINTGALATHSLIWALLNLLKDIDINICQKYLNAVNLPLHYYKNRTINLSGGEKQRVAIAKLLRQKPKYLLADEPLANLDPYLSNHILKLLLCKKQFHNIGSPLTSLISLHQPELINNFTRVIGLKEGRLILDCEPRLITESQLNSLY